MAAEFTDEDVDLTQLLAAQAAVAIENARLYESTTRWLRQFETLNEIGNALASEVELTPLLALVARRLRELARRAARAHRPARAGDGAPSWRPRTARGPMSCSGRASSSTDSKMGRVLERGRSERVDSVLEDPEVDQATARRLGVHAGLYVPLVIGGKAIGVVMAHDRVGPDASLQRRRSAAGGDTGRTSGDRRRPLAACQPGRGAPGGGGAGAGAQAARA